MIVFKFGGASVKTPGGILNLAHIVSSFKEPLVIVVSALGKTTNALEKVHDLAWIKDPAWEIEMAQVQEYHASIARELFLDTRHPIFARVNEVFNSLRDLLVTQEHGDYDRQYDQVVSCGEVLSTLLVSSFLNEREILNRWVDIRGFLKTDSTWREGNVDWDNSTSLIKQGFNLETCPRIVTQGFIGSNPEGFTTTLGREGSDYTAAILAHVLHAERVIIWKDVPGVLNADPKYFDNTVRLGQLSYLDAIELAYYGASVIHPKTIKPLQNKGIHLHVKSFVYPNDPGTIVGDASYESLVPSFIFKMNQMMIRLAPLDFSFIAEENLETIFGVLSRVGVKINLMQNSAVSFMICTNHDESKLQKLRNELESLFRVDAETGLELITVRYYDTATIERVLVNKEVILEQRNGKTIQIVVRDQG